MASTADETHPAWDIFIASVNVSGQFALLENLVMQWKDACLVTVANVEVIFVCTPEILIARFWLYTFLCHSYWFQSVYSNTCLSKYVSRSIVNRRELINLCMLLTFVALVAFVSSFEYYSTCGKNKAASVQQTYIRLTMYHTHLPHVWCISNRRQLPRLHKCSFIRPNPRANRKCSLGTNTDSRPRNAGCTQFHFRRKWSESKW